MGMLSVFNKSVQLSMTIIKIKETDNYEKNVYYI